MKLTDARHAFISGGASGIGLAIGEALAARGVAVSLADIDGPVLDAVVAERGPRFAGYRLDVRDREGWASARAQAEAKFGPVDILVNNAGIAPDGNKLADIPFENWDRIIGINLTGVFNGIATFGAAIRALGRGHIVNTASMAGLAAHPSGGGAYCVAKAGVVMMSEALRNEMAPHGVGVSVLCPGLVATNLGETTQKVTGIVRGGDPNIMASGIAPASVGEAVAAAIEADELYIITHRDRWENVEARHAAIAAAFA